MSKSETIELEVISASSGKKSGSCSINAAVFAKKSNKGLLHQIVRWQRAKKRSGTHKVLTRREEHSSDKKPWQQKGTGRARAGSTSSPLWVGGGIAHGPKPRSYEFSLNRKQKALALCQAMSEKLADGGLKVVDGFEIKGGSPNTKSASEMLIKLGCKRGEKVLVIVPETENLLTKSLRNIDGVKVLSGQGLNVYDILGARHLVVLSEALPQLESRVSA